MSLVMNSKILKRTIDIAKAMCPLNIEHRCSHIAFLIRCGKIVHIGTKVEQQQAVLWLSKCGQAI